MHDDADALVTSRSILSDLRIYFLARPPIPTLIRFASEEEREDYTLRILQRLGISVRDYRVLNIHKIGIDAPVSVVFEEILSWDGGAPCWPNHIATVDQLDEARRHIRILLLGGMPLFGQGLGTLFRLEATRTRRVPDAADVDNARYILFECSGGYPIGIFAIYARSGIPEQGETETSQVFMSVGFNFYGLRWWPGVRVVKCLWEVVHNRVTANVMNRFKRLCETKFLNLTSGEFSPRLAPAPGEPLRAPRSTPDAW
jgi:hypothetical protein